MTVSDEAYLAGTSRSGPDTKMDILAFSALLVCLLLSRVIPFRIYSFSLQLVLVPYDGPKTSPS